MRSTSIALAPFVSVLSRLLPGLIVGLLAVSFAHADPLTDFERRQRHEYEQCANDCQLKLDDRMFKCMPYRKDKEKKVKEDCPETAYEKYERCERKCPANPRDQG
jgi:hypothetical protein